MSLHDAWVDGLTTGFNEGHFHKYLPINYRIGSDERREWHDGFGKGCQIHQEAAQRLADTIEGDLSRRNH